MPLYDFTCEICGKTIEMLLLIEHNIPTCCGSVMRRVYAGRILLKEKYPLWVDRIEDIHKAQEEKGEKLRFVHPSEVL